MHTRQVRKWMEIYWPKKSCSLLWLLVGCHFYAANDTSFLVCLSLYLFPFVFLSFCLSVFLSFCLSVFLSPSLTSFLCVCLSVSISFSVLIKWQNIRDCFRLAVDKNVLTWAECMSVCLCLCLITLSLSVNVWLVCFCFYILLVLIKSNHIRPSFSPFLSLSVFI